MGHSHLHKRRHVQLEKRQGGLLGDLENGLSQLAGSLTGGNSGNSGSSNNDNNNNNNGGGGNSGSSNSNSNNNNKNSADDDGPSTVYVTASWTGKGSYSLSTELPPATTKAAPPPATTAAPATLQTSASQKRSTAQVSTSAAVAATSAAVSTILSSSSSDSFTSSTTSISAAAATTSTAALQDASSGGLSGGAKAGIAIGVILGILALVAGAFALYRMKKARDESEAEMAASSEKNPFSDSAAADRLPPMPTQAAYNGPSQPANPFEDRPAPMGPTNVSNHVPTAANMAMAGIAGAGAGAIVGAAAADRRNNAPEPLNLNRAQSPALIPPPVVASSPAVSNFSESSMISSAAGGPPPRMHRVQMDFNPTMEDELGIRAGEIVRILRDFDDGWCTVEIVEKDPQSGKPVRHQQGVVPRTCLSRLPLKPRQRKAGPPNGPQGSPPKMNGSHMGPGRVQSPALVPNPVQRSMSPGPYGGGPQPQRPAEQRSRSNSAGNIDPRAKPEALGPSPMNPAARTSDTVELPIQTTSPIIPAPLQHGHTRTSSVPNPSNPGLTRAGSVGSAVSAPVARKPVPRKD